MIGGILILFLAIIAYRFGTGKSGVDARRQNIAQVKIEKPQRENFASQLQFNGDVLPIQQAFIYSKVNGTLASVRVNMGAFVKQNQLLALIDTTELSQQMQLAAATYQNARLTYFRTKELSEQNLISKQELDNADATMKVAKSNYDIAKTRHDYAFITAPFSGYITKRFLDPGAVLTTANATIFSLMDLSTVKIIVNALEKDIPLISIGKRAIVSVDAYPGKKFSGVVTRFSNAIDLSTRTMAVELTVPNKELFLTPGMFAQVTLLLNNRENVLTLPGQAILKDANGQFVFIVNQNIAHKVVVVVGGEQNSRTEIRSGLQGDESVIVVGQQFVKDNNPVHVQK